MGSILAYGSENLKAVFVGSLTPIMKLMLLRNSCLEHFANAGAMCKTAYAATLLIFALGCHQRSQVSDDARGVGTTAGSATNAAMKANYAPAELRSRANAAMVASNDTSMLMSIWRSPSSTTDERIGAVNKLLSPETTMESAIALLGKDHALSHHFGPSFGVTQVTNAEQALQANGVDYFVLQYNTPSGLVALRFPRGHGNRLHFDRAYAVQPEGP